MWGKIWCRLLCKEGHKQCAGGIVLVRMPIRQALPANKKGQVSPPGLLNIKR